MANSRRTKNPILMPVIHGYSLQTVNWNIKALNKIGDFEAYGMEV